MCTCVPKHVQRLEIMCVSLLLSILVFEAVSLNLQLCFIYTEVTDQGASGNLLVSALQELLLSPYPTTMLVLSIQTKAVTSKMLRVLMNI